MIGKINARHGLFVILRDRISDQDFAMLSLEGGFSPPNNFSIHHIEDCVKFEQLPQADHLEYAFAIYECSRERIAILSPYVRVMLSALFVYCHKHTTFGPPVESAYYQLGLEGVFECGSSELSFAYLDFLDWLSQEVTPHDGYESYFCFLAIAYLRAHLGRTDDIEYFVALEALAAKCNTTSEHELTVVQEGLSWWREISSEMVGGDARKRQLTAMLPST